MKNGGVTGAAVVVRVCVFCFWALLPAAARAESLPELLRAAQGANSAYLAALARLDAAREALPLAEGALFPFASLSGDFRADLGGNEQTARDASASISLPLYDRALKLGPTAAAFDERAAEARVRAAEQNLISAVAGAYLDALFAQENLRLIRARKAAIREQLQLAQSNLETGVGTATDVQEAQARLEEVAAEEITAAGDLEIRRKEIERLCGFAPRSLDALIAGFGDGGLADGHAAVADVAARIGGGAPPVGRGDSAALLAWFADIAAAANPDLRAAAESLSSARTDVEIKKAEVLPKVTASASLNYSRISGGGGGMGGGGGDDDTSRRIGIRFEMPLYSARINPALRSLIAEERALALDAEGMRRDLERRVLEYYLQIENGAARIRALSTAVDANRGVLRSTKIGFQSGVRINSDVLNAQQALFDAEVNLQQARYDYLASRLNLAAVAGALDEAAIDEFARNFSPSAIRRE